jgi:pimeloyl-ACP methyl ester carboxylesterase
MRGTSKRFAVLSLACTLALACSTPAPAPREAVATRPTLNLAPCAVAKSTTDARCGTYPVFEDRAAKTGRVISLNILVLPALTESPVPDPIFVLAGGPGLGAASGVTRDVVEYFGPMRSQRDVVFVDQRGTGESHRLQCRLVPGGSAAQNSFGDLLPADRIRACRHTLETIADLRLYTTPIAMDDLDEVRDALGYATINLYGVSYGSLAALQYLRQHPARVRSLSLAGVATPAQKLPLHFVAGAQAALDHAIADCAADEACHRAFPDLRTDVTTAFAQFSTGPVTFDLPSAAGHGPERVSMSRAVFAERLRLMLYNLRSARRVPLVLHRAAQRDWVPFAQATSPTLIGVSPAFAMGMYLTVTCSESVAVITEDDVVRESRGSFVGEDRVRVHMRACQEWPRGRIPAGFYAPVASPVPVLMLSGQVDAATPAHFGGAAARSLPNSRQILIRNAAHWYFDDCLRDLVSDFVVRGSARDLDTRCIEALRRPPFVTQ